MSQYMRGSKRWIKMKGPDEVVRRFPGFDTKRATDELERKMEVLRACRQAGELPDAVLLRWIDTLSPAFVARLVKYGFIDERRGATTKPLLVMAEEQLTGGHVHDWLTHLKDKGDCDRHIRQETAKMIRVVRGCRWTFPGDMQASDLLGWLEVQVNSQGNPISIRTRNDIAGTVKAFGRWMVRERRMQENPFSHLSRKNVKLDRRRIRRPFMDDELIRLVTAAERGPVYQRIDGPMRATVYLLASETGLRSLEIRSLTRASFDLDADMPSVTVLAAYSKNRREDTLPLRPRLAARLRIALAHHRPEDPAFPLPGESYVVRMLRLDLDATADPMKGLEAVPYIDADGKVADFHSLRHTFITNLARSGVHPKVAQELGRHGDINITLGTYTHIELEKRSEAVRRLPEIMLPGDAADNLHADAADDLPLDGNLDGTVSA